MRSTMRIGFEGLKKDVHKQEIILSSELLTCFIKLERQEKMNRYASGLKDAYFHDHAELLNVIKDPRSLSFQRNLSICISFQCINFKNTR